MTCTHWAAGRHCGATPTRLYLPGRRCAAHTPAALNGRPEAAPDPERTLDALRAARGLVWAYNPNDTALNDQRAIASGRRRSTPEDYRAAQAAEQTRKAAR